MNGDISSEAKFIIDYLLHHHSEITEQIIHELGVTSNIISEFDSAGTLHEARVVISWWREIMKCLKTYLNLDKL